jgi:hypothetical protein
VPILLLVEQVKDVAQVLHLLVRERLWLVLFFFYLVLFNRAEMSFLLRAALPFVLL